MFGAFAGDSNATVGGKNWDYHASGIAGNNGDVNPLTGGNYSLNLGGGAGMSTVAIPEPSTVVLLISGFLGLLAYAWRKRK